MRSYGSTDIKMNSLNFTAPPNSPTTSAPEMQCSLEKIGQDIDQIKSSLEKKRPKVTMVELNEKLNYIIELLQHWHINDHHPGPM